jgi:hypothetical protein
MSPLELTSIHYTAFNVYELVKDRNAEETIREQWDSEAAASHQRSVCWCIKSLRKSIPLSRLDLVYLKDRAKLQTNCV